MRHILNFTFLASDLINKVMNYDFFFLRLFNCLIYSYGTYNLNRNRLHSKLKPPEIKYLLKYAFNYNKRRHNKCLILLQEETYLKYSS